MRRTAALAALIGVMLVLSGCVAIECPDEYARPLQRARFCGPANVP